MGEEGFAVYLLSVDTPPSKIAALSHLKLASEPLIAMEDVISYSGTDHEIELTASAYDRLRRIGVPVWGKVFVVCVNRQPVYSGAFWAIYSSQSFDGVIILTPLPPGKNAIRIELGYPGAGFFKGEDPRSDGAILESLRKAGKLK
ncbi:MAG: hypothetical protein Q8O43_00810 [Dehalococcoidia bacterium]|nr:hypothetical protein [Dehalococcoidia bacterium]